jgi:hypothetical protein
VDSTDERNSMSVLLIRKGSEWGMSASAV